ncbi:MAG: alpha/beta hydrolase [Treponema sp.]|nr:alpha/beta hydrolase [Treponema sp.]
MKPWPSLQVFAKTLSLRGEEETLFYYDTEAGSDSPSSKPVLALIHGLGDEADSWRRVIPLLRNRFRVLAPDLPGFGRSKAPGRINLKRHTRALFRLLDEAGVSEAYPAALVGNSMGAVIAEEAAFTQPKLTRALILEDGCFPSALPLGAGLLLMACPFIGKKQYRSYRKNHERAYRSLLPYYEDLEGMNEEDRRFLRERVIARVESSSQERAYFGSLRSLIWTYQTGKDSFAQRFIAFPGKTLILWGDRDRVISPDSARILRNLRQDVVFKSIPAAGHLPHQENPAAVAEAIAAFLMERT